VETAPAVQALVSTSNPQDEDLIALAAEALVWMGDPAQAKELLRKAYGGNARLRILVAQAATLFGNRRWPKTWPRSSPGVEGIAEGLRAAAHRSVVVQRRSEAGLRHPRRPVQRPRQAARRRAACGTDARCWLERLKDPDPEVRARAAYELGRREPRKRPLPWLARRGKSRSSSARPRRAPWTGSRRCPRRGPR